MDAIRVVDSVGLAQILEQIYDDMPSSNGNGIRVYGIGTTFKFAVSSGNIIVVYEPAQKTYNGSTSANVATASHIISFSATKSASIALGVYVYKQTGPSTWGNVEIYARYTYTAATSTGQLVFSAQNGTSVFTDVSFRAVII